MLFGSSAIAISLDDKILDLSKLKVFADDNSIVAQMVQFFSDRVESIVGKGENAGYQYFSPFPEMISIRFFFRI